MSGSTNWFNSPDWQILEHSLRTAFLRRANPSEPAVVLPLFAWVDIDLVPLGHIFRGAVRSELLSRYKVESAS